MEVKMLAKKSIIAAAFLLLSGCGMSEEESLREENERLQSRVDELERQLGQAKDAGNNLENNVARLQDENWRDVVPDVESDAEELSNALE